MPITLSYLPNVYKIETHFQLELISADDDDNKFSDCAFGANVHFLVTNDQHFKVLKTVGFPSINVITLEDFNILLSEAWLSFPTQKTFLFAS